MKLKKLITIFLLAMLLASQFGWLNFTQKVYATEIQTVGNFHYDQLGVEAKKIYQAMNNMYTEGILKTGTQSYDLVENGFFTEDDVKEYEKGNMRINFSNERCKICFLCRSS